MVQHARKSSSREFYTAAVVEYTSRNIILPDREWAARDLMESNAEQYVRIIQNASNYDVDIIVFPECGLAGTPVPKRRADVKPYLITIPTPEDHAIPYQEPHKYDKILTMLSKAAKDSNMYVVVNLFEIVACPSDDQSSICRGQDRNYHYNTNLVFDRQGQIIAKYRKFNLFLEYAFDTTPQPEMITFNTDFGVTFGTFTCFDILFPQPAVQLAKQKNITDFVYTAAWMSELPLLTAVTVHSSWAFSMDVNLLSSNYNNPAQYGGGSGIYAGRQGIKVAVMPQYTGSQLLISRVPKKSSVVVPKSESHVVPLIPVPTHHKNQLRLLCDSSYRFFHCKPLESFSDEPKTTSTFSYSESKYGFSCSIEVTWSNKDPNNNMPSYKMFGYAGERTFSGAKTCYIEACGLSAVRNDNGNTTGCGLIPDLYDSGVTIHSIKITATSSDMKTIAIPSTLNSSIIPLDVADYTFTNDGKSIQMNLVNPSTDLITFAVYKLPREVP
ncbi:hypothetical protein M8J75_011727 [Diaphorina citri]|nr:hypothetical protein M8J75_011727 [Diaphorina citri]